MRYGKNCHMLIAVVITVTFLEMLFVLAAVICGASSHTASLEIVFDITEWHYESGYRCYIQGSMTNSVSVT